MLYIAIAAWLVCAVIVGRLISNAPVYMELDMPPFRHGYRNYGYDGKEVHLWEFGRGTKRMRLWASDVEEAETLARKAKFRGPYDRIAMRPQGVIGEPEGYCRGKQ